MNPFNLLTAIDQLQPCSVWIASTANNQHKDILEFSAKVVSQDKCKIFILDNNLCDLKDNPNFILGIGSVLHDGTGFYTCTQVCSFEKLNKTYTILVAELNT